MSGPFECACGQCWYGRSADWGDVERTLSRDGFTESEIARFRSSLEGRFEFHRPDPPGRPPMRGDARPGAQQEAVR